MNQPSRSSLALRPRLRRGAALVLVAALPLVAMDGGTGCETAAPPPDAGFAARQQAYLEYAAAEPGNGGVHTQIARLALGQPIVESAIRSRFDKIRERRDTADFDVVALTRFLYLFRDSPLVSRPLIAELEKVLYDFKYWIDEPGTDTMVYWSENHQILFPTAEYLLGQLYPDALFTNSGLTGAEHVEKARPRILAWLRDRARFGYSEWMSNTYYEEDAAPLLALIDFAADPEIRTRAAMAMDLLALDMALNSYQGTFGTTHGRAYRGGKMSGRSEATMTMQKILFDRGIYRGRNEWAGTALATSTRYAPPAVISEIARDDAVRVFRQRNGIDVEEGPRYGYSHDPQDFTAGMFYWGMGAYPHARVVNTTLTMAEGYGLFADGGFFAPFEFLLGIPRGLVVGLTALLSPIAEGSALEKTNIYTYRTADGMLSSGQDKMKGQLGFQQHAWQATLGIDAVVWTTHPGPFEEGNTGGLSVGADYWAGGTSMPRVGQHENVAVILYDPEVETMLGGILDGVFPKLTHAYFPQHAFDEVVRTGGWTIARKDEGYVALWSANPADFATEGDWAGVDLIAEGARNAWICELGRAADSGSFADFVAAIAAAPVQVVDGVVRYDSPSQGLVTFGWEGALTVAGVERDLGDYPRYVNDFTDTRWGAGRLHLDRDGSTLTLDFARGTRTGS